MSAPRPWGFAPSRIGGQEGLYCVTPDCGALITKDGTRWYDHIEDCETRVYEAALKALLRITS